MATLVARDNEGGAGHIIASVLVASVESFFVAPLCNLGVGSCCHLIAVNWPHPWPLGPPGVLVPCQDTRARACQDTRAWPCQEPGVLSAGVLLCRLLVSLDCI